MPEKHEYKHGQFCWVDLMSDDMAAARTFYKQVFDWDSQDLDARGGPPYALFTLRNKPVAGVAQLSDEKKEGMAAVWNSYVNVDDIDAVVEKATSLGASVLMPVTKVLDAGSMAVIKDPTGASIAFWLRDRSIGAGLIQETGCFCWNELAMRDIDLAKDFYGKLFEWEFKEYAMAPTRYYTIQCGGEEIGGLMQMNDDWGDMPANWNVYFNVADTDATVQKVEDAGGTICVPPFEIPVGRMAVVGDKGGASFAVIHLCESPHL